MDIANVNRARTQKKRSVWFRGLAEMVRVGVSLGARRETFYGLSGVGDYYKPALVDNLVKAVQSKNADAVIKVILSTDIASVYTTTATLYNLKQDTTQGLWKDKP